MAGKTCLVTGVTSGLGAVTARELAARGATVLAVARDGVRGRAAVAGIGQQAPAGAVRLLVADLSELDQVRRLAAEVRDASPRLDVLVHNAGVAKFSRETTADGLETTFATNHLAPFLLTNLLREHLLGSNPARVVTVSSAAHKQVRKIPWDDLQAEHRFRPLEVYNLTKLMNVLFTVELARRLEATGVTANCVSPGFLHTNLGREATGGFRLFFSLARPFQKSAEHGVATTLQVACAPELAAVTGCYFRAGKIAEPSALARDRAAAERLWTLSAELSGLDATDSPDRR